MSESEPGRGRFFARLNRFLEVKAPSVIAAREAIEDRQRQEEAQRTAILERLTEIGERRLSGDLPTDTETREHSDGAPRIRESGAAETRGGARSGDYLVPSRPPRPSPLDRQNAARFQQMVDGISALVELANNEHAQAKTREAQSETRYIETMAVAKAGARWGKVAAITGLVGIPTTVILGVLAIVLAN